MKNTIISIANQKGGVGKTTTSINLSTALAAFGKQTLLIDLDPQSNATTGLGVYSSEYSIYDVLAFKKDINVAIQTTNIPNLKLISACKDLAGAEIELSNADNGREVLKQLLKKVSGQFEYVIIDCPPALGFLTINALIASDYVLIPLQAEYFALEGLGHLIGTLKRIKLNLNTKIEILGILLTMYDKRSTLAERVENEVRSTFGDLVFNAYIPRNTKISESPSFGKSALIYDISCNGSQAYIKLTSEVIKRNERYDHESKKACVG